MSTTTKKFFTIVLSLIAFVLMLILAVWIGYSQGVSQKSRDLQGILAESADGHISAENINKIYELGGLPQNYGQTFIDEKGNTCMASLLKDDVISVLVVKDYEGNELIKTKFDPVDFSTSYEPVGSNTIEENTYYWVPEYSGNVITRKYYNNDGSERFVNIKEIAGYRQISNEDFKNHNF